MIESLLQPEVGKIVGAEFISQEGSELFVLLDEGIFPIGAEDMMAVLDLVDDGAEFTAKPSGQPDAKNFADFVGGPPPESHFARAFEDFVNGGIPLEDEVDAITIGAFHAAEPRRDVVFLAHAFLGPFDGEVAIARKGFHPVLIVLGSLNEHAFVDSSHADHLTEKCTICSGRDNPLRYPLMTIRSKH